VVLPLAPVCTARLPSNQQVHDESFRPK
jgi:hypothetical protein